MLAQQFGKTSGYEKWHRHLGHTSNKDIQDTIKYIIGLEELLLDNKDKIKKYKLKLKHENEELDEIEEQTKKLKLMRKEK